MKNKRLWSALILSLTFFIATICLVFNTNSKDVLAEVNTDIQKFDPSSYFSWKNDWQKNNAVKVTSLKQENVAINPPTLYNRAIANTYSFNLLEGDTKPVLNSSAYTFGLITPIIAIEWPVFQSVDPTVYYEYSNPSYWKGLPENVDGKFTSSKSNWPNVAHWTGWPNGNVKTTAYVLYPKGSTQNDWLSYTFSNEAPNNVTMGVSTQVKVDDSYEKPIQPQVSWIWGIGWNIEIPQVVKAVFKDIDDPDGDPISEDEVLGYGGEMADSVTLKNKELAGYHFVSSQEVFGPTITSTGFGVGIKEPDSFYYDEKTTSIKEPTAATSWTTTIDRQQKGIVFWYKKETPNISLTKQANKTEVFVGETLTYNINTANNGDADLVNAKITDKVPEGLSKPSNIKLDNDLLPENQGNDGKYYTWNNTTNELTVFTGNLKINENKKLTYDTTIINGTPGETKTNYAELSGDNSNQRPSGSADVTVKKKIITLDIEDIIATTGDTDISVNTTISAETDFTDLVNGTLTIKYPQDNLSLGNMKVTQNGKDITSGTTIDKSIKNIVKIQGINANNIKEYPVTVQFDQSSALIEMDKTAYVADIQSEDLSATTNYNIEIKEGKLQLLWVPDTFDFGSHNLEELKQNEFDTTTNLPAYVVVSDTRSKSDTNSWRVEATSSDLIESTSNSKITDFSYYIGDNNLKEYTSDDNSIPPSDTTIGAPPESWNNYVQVKQDILIQNGASPTSNIISAKKGVENGKYAIEVNQAKLTLNNLNQITGKSYNGMITWTLVDSL